MTRALLMAAGQQSRWPSDQRKHLAVLESEPLLERTVRQLRQRQVEAVIVSGDPRLEVGGIERFEPGPTSSLVETVMLSSPRFATDRTVVLLGDVYFTDAALDTVLGAQGLRVAGRFGTSLLTGGGGEIFAMVWDDAQGPTMTRALAVAVDDAHTQQAAGQHGKTTEPGSLWQVYRHLIGADLYEHRCDASVWLEIDDWTDDIDTPSRYEDFTKRLARRWLSDQG